MIVLNLFIGVIMNSMEEVQQEQNLEKKSLGEIGAFNMMAGDIEGMQDKMTEMQEQLNIIAYWLRQKQEEVDSNT